MIIFTKNEKAVTDAELIEKFDNMASTAIERGRIDRLKMKIEEIWGLVNEFKII